jgi:hypothetical protein
VIGLSATSQGDVQDIIEEVVTAPKKVTMLEFKSEYEFITKKSPLNGSLEMLAKNDDILPKIIEKCQQTYSSRPIICFLTES